MKLHSDTLTDSDIYLAIRNARDLDGVADHVSMDTFRSAGTRTRARAWDIHLGTDTRDRDATGKMRRKPTNSANQDDLADYAATYSEWGWFIARLFETDPNAVFGPYKGKEHFDNATLGRFIL